MQLNWIITDNNITVNIDDKSYIIKRDRIENSSSEQLIKALKENNLKEIKNLISMENKIKNFSENNFIVENGCIMIAGKPAPLALSEKIIRFAEKGLPFQPLLRFAEKLHQNPSDNSVKQLYQFLDKNDHPITENGNFLAYKKVRNDFKDVHSGKFDNSVGNTLEVSWSEVDPNPEKTCSHGLHVANYDYAHNFYAGGIMLAVEVNPADVVAVPVDYNQAKMRVKKYKVLAVVNNKHGENVDLVTQANLNASFDNEDDSENDSD